jgi:hypothetical protein
VLGTSISVDGSRLTASSMLGRVAKGRAAELSSECRTYRRMNSVERSVFSPPQHTKFKTLIAISRIVFRR